MNFWDTNWTIITIFGIFGGILTGFSYLWYVFIERAIWTSTLKELIAENNSSNNPYPNCYQQAQYNTPATMYRQYPPQQILNGWVAPHQDPQSRQSSTNNPQMNVRKRTRWGAQMKNNVHCFNLSHFVRFMTQLIVQFSVLLCIYFLVSLENVLHSCLLKLCMMKMLWH